MLFIFEIISLVLGITDLFKKRHVDKIIKETKNKYFKNHVLLLCVLSILSCPILIILYQKKITSN